MRCLTHTRRWGPRTLFGHPCILPSTHFSNGKLLLSFTMLPSIPSGVDFHNNIHSAKQPPLENGLQERLPRGCKLRLTSTTHSYLSIVRCLMINGHSSNIIIPEMATVNTLARIFIWQASLNPLTRSCGCVPNADIPRRKENFHSPPPGPPLYSGSGARGSLRALSEAFLERLKVTPFLSQMLFAEFCKGNSSAKQVSLAPGGFTRRHVCGRPGPPDTD